MQMLHLQVISPGAKRNRLFNCFEYLDRPALYSLSKALSGTLFWKPINSSAATFQQCSERLPPGLEKMSSFSSVVYYFSAKVGVLEELKNIFDFSEVYFKSCEINF